LATGMLVLCIFLLLIGLALQLPPPAPPSLPDTFFYKHVMEETGTYLGEGGEEEDVRSSEQAEKLHLFGGRSQWMHLVYSGRTGMSN